MTCSGAGALMGALFVAWVGTNKHMGRVLNVSVTLFGAIIVGFALVREACLAALVLFIGGLLFVVCSSIATSLAQLLVPQALRGRVASIYLVAFLGGSPLGALTTGWLMTTVGSAPIPLVINGLILALLGLHCLSNHRLEDIEASSLAA